MIETLLRTITNRGIWKFIWLPHISTITLRSNEPLTYDTNFPLSHDSLLIRGYDRRYLCIPSSTSLPISTLFSFPWYVIPCEPVTCLQANWMTFHREGPEYIWALSVECHPISLQACDCLTRDHISREREKSTYR